MPQRNFDFDSFPKFFCLTSSRSLHLHNAVNPHHTPIARRNKLDQIEDMSHARRSQRIAMKREQTKQEEPGRDLIRELKQEPGEVMYYVQKIVDKRPG